VTLNAVIENLAALRDGKSPPSPPSERLAAARPEHLAKTKAVVEEQASAFEPASESVDHEAIWRKVVEETRSRRRLISGWVESARALGIDGRFFLVGFPPQEKTAMESLSIPRTRDFLEALLKEISGRDWKIKFALKEGLPVVTPAETAAPKKQETQATFKDDPLIREALEIFKGEIRTVTD